MLILERPWTRQPQGQVRPNLKSDLLAGASLFMPMNGSPVDLISGKLATLGAGASTSVGVLGKSLQGSGSAAVASIPIDLSGVSKVAISFWLNWPAYATDYDMALEYTADGGANAGFYISPNAGTGYLQVSQSAAGGGPVAEYIRPSAGLHHYVFNLDRSLNASSGAVVLYVDGLLTEVFSASGSSRAGNYANSTLFILSRNNSSLFGAGAMTNLVVRPGVVMRANQAWSEYRYPWQLFAPRRIPIPTPAAAASAPTITALSARLITATSAQPRISYS